jgi:hypothetical protein
MDLESGIPPPCSVPCRIASELSRPSGDCFLNRDHPLGVCDLRNLFATSRPLTQIMFFVIYLTLTSFLTSLVSADRLLAPSHPNLLR